MSAEKWKYAGELSVGDVWTEQTGDRGPRSYRVIAIEPERVTDYGDRIVCDHRAAAHDGLLSSQPGRGFARSRHSPHEDPSKGARYSRRRRWSRRPSDWAMDSAAAGCWPFPRWREMQVRCQLGHSNAWAFRRSHNKSDTFPFDDDPRRRLWILLILRHEIVLSHSASLN